MPREGSTEESAQAHSATAAATRSTPASNRRGAARSRGPLTPVTACAAAGPREPQSGTAASVTAPPSGRPATGFPPSSTPLSFLVVVVSRINSPARGKATFNAAAGLIARAHRPGDAGGSGGGPGGDS